MNDFASIAPALMEAPLFEGVATGTAERLLAGCYWGSYAPAERVLRQGAPCSAMALVVKGTVDIIVRHPESGSAALLGRCGTGDVIGDVELIADRLVAADCVAATHVQCLLANRHLVVEAMQDAIFLRNLMRVQYARLIRDNQGKLMDQFGALEQRLCDVLLRLSIGGPDIVTTQSDLAALLGCARQSLNKSLKALRTDGTIDVETGRIRVLNRKGLEARAILRPEEFE